MADEKGGGDNPQGGGEATPLKVEGLLGRMSPSCRGLLKRRTRFTRAWRSEPDMFEIRSSILVLYKHRKGTAGGGFLDMLFSRNNFTDWDANVSSAADLPAAGQPTDVQGGGAAANWSYAFDLTGASLTVLPADEKAKTFPFKLTFVVAANGSDDRTLNLCAESEADRAMWMGAITTATMSVDRALFTLLKMVGRGQWGKVFLVKKTAGVVAVRLPTAKPYAYGGEQSSSTEILALKEVALSSKTNITHVQNERLIMEAVPPHEFIVNMQYAFRSGRFLYYALDFMNGGDLFRHWRRHKDRRAEMAPFYAAEVMLALEHLHKYNVIYRDLKPENVLLDDLGHVKLADLGLAKILKDKAARTNSFCGTEAYLAPELILRLPYAYSVDFWQFGCFVFELYAGRSPFWLPRKPRKFVRDNIVSGAFAFPNVVPEEVKPLVSALLNVDERERLGSQNLDDMWAGVRADPYFSGMDWDKLAAKQLTPPIVPEDPGPEQVGNFDEDFTIQTPIWGEHPDGPGNDSVHAFEDELLGFSFVRMSLGGNSEANSV